MAKPKTKLSGNIKKKDLQLVMDAFVNAMNGIGGANDPNNLLTFGTGVKMDRLLADNLYTYDWLAKRVVNILPQEALREGYTLGLEMEGEELIKQKFSELGFTDILTQALIYGRLYGGTGIVVGAIDGMDPSEPLNTNNIANIAFLQLANRYELTPHTYYTDVMTSKYGQVETYMYNPISNSGSSPSFIVHETRIIKIPGDPTARNQQLRNSMWNDSVLQAFYEANKTYSMAIQTGGHLLQDFVSKVWTMPDLAEYLEDEATLQDRMKVMIQSSSSIGAIALGEGEKFEKLSTPVTGLADIIKTIAKNASSASGIPESVLFGESLGQLSGAQAARDAFQDTTRNYQKTIVRPVIEAMLDMLLLDKSFPIDYESTEYNVEFTPLQTPSQKEMLEMKKLQAEIDEKYVNAGILSPGEIREAFYGDYTFERKADEEGDAYLEEATEKEAAAMESKNNKVEE